MTTREEFGSYLLLKKLAEDPLGETFRAGKLGPQGVEQVVLLRVFNGEGIDGPGLWEEIAGRGPVLEALKSPNIGSGVDLGQVQGVPYVAYDYISGKDLASLMQQARRAPTPVPTDHALLIAERIALGLAMAYETKVGEQRVLHGLLTPELVMLSNEGEIRVLGFESAAALRGVASGRPELSPYLAPEARTGAPLSKQDDVYSLGAVLLELLTGQPPAAEISADDLARAVSAAERKPLPPAIRGLLERTLAPRDQRPGDVVTWHKALSKLMIEGQFNPTTFNLAFFMHNLFREDIERESREIEVEKTIELPIAAPAATVAVPAAPIPELTGEPVDDTEALRERYDMPAAAGAGGRRRNLAVALAALLVLAAGGAGALYYLGILRPQPEPPTAEEAAAPEIPAPEEPSAPLPEAGDAEAAPGEPAAEAQPAGPTADELRAQIDQMLAERTAAMEASLRAQYDQRLKNLQTSLEEAQQAAAELERQQAAPAREPAVAAAGPGAEPPTPEPTRPTPATQAPPSATPPAATAPAPAQPQPAPTGEARPPAPTPPSEPREAPAPAAQPRKPPPSGEAAQPPGPAPAPPEPAPAPKVRFGDLVEPGPGVEPPKLERMPPPRYPPVAQRLNRQATVLVRVLVNENGRVEKVELAGKEVGFGFDDAALAAAEQARYLPATKDGVKVKMWVSVRVDFRP